MHSSFSYLGNGHGEIACRATTADPGTDDEYTCTGSGLLGPAGKGNWNSSQVICPTTYFGPQTHDARQPGLPLEASASGRRHTVVYHPCRTTCPRDIAELFGGLTNRRHGLGNPGSLGSSSGGGTAVRDLEKRGRSRAYCFRIGATEAADGNEALLPVLQPPRPLHGVSRILLITRMGSTAAVERIVMSFKWKKGQARARRKPRHGGGT